MRLAPKHRSIASNTVDFPLSPVPIRQLMPGDGHHTSCWMPRKLDISIFLILAIGCPCDDVRPVLLRKPWCRSTLRSVRLRCLRSSAGHRLSSNSRRPYREPPMQLAQLMSSARLSLRRSVWLEGWRRSDTERPSPDRDHDLANEPWDCVCQGKHRLKFA